MPLVQHQYVVHSSLHEDMNEGWIWIRDLKDELDGKRRLILIGTENGKSAYCEALYADPWYMEKWLERWKKNQDKLPGADQHLAFISSWYRRRLGIGLGQRTLTVEYCEGAPFSWQLRVCFQHPQVVVRLAMLLAVIGLGLGIVALGFGILAIPDWRPAGAWIGWLIALLGCFVMIFVPIWGSRT